MKIEVKNKKLAIYWIIGVLIVIIDQASKIYFTEKVIKIIPGVLKLHYVCNEGAAFGIGENSTSLSTIITVLSVLIIVGLIIYLFKERVKNYIPYTMVIAGAFGNIFDRIQLGYVRDFIDLEIIHFPVFNIADICIVMGIFLIAFNLIKGMVKKDMKDYKFDRIVLASNNQHKIKEFKEILKDKEILSLKDIGYNKEINEIGETFEENALIKAKEIHEYLKNQVHDIMDNKYKNTLVIADDSGLCVDSLGGAPGVYSARYAGNHGDDQANRDKLQEELKGKDRKAYFNCTIVVYYPDNNYKVFEGRTYGIITEEELGSKEFGYDCIFKSDDLNKTFGEATEEEKNSVSHRGRAIEKMLKEL